MSTHKLCFGAKLRKLGIPLHTIVLLYKVGFKGVYISQTCFLDDYGWHTQDTPSSSMKKHMFKMYIYSSGKHFCVIHTPLYLFSI